MPDKKKVLICHLDDDAVVFKELEGVLEGAGMEVRDAVVPYGETTDAEEDEQVRCEIRAPQVDWCDALVILITAASGQSGCVNWEIEYAVQHGKRVVGVFGDGAGNADVPSALQAYGDATVPRSWVQRVIDAVNGDIQPDETWEDPETAKPRDPEWPVERHKCRH